MALSILSNSGKKPASPSIKTKSRLTNLLRIILPIAFALSVGCASKEEKSPPPPDQPTPAEINVRSASDLLRQGNPELALQKVLAALEQDPELPSAYDVAGRIYEQSGQSELAGKYFKRAVTLDPRNPNFINNYGQHLCRLGDFKQAEQQFLLVATTYQGRIKAAAYANAGLCSVRIPDYDRAAQYFRAALEVNPNLAVVYYQLARVYFEKKRYPQARRNLDSYQRHGEHTPATLWLGLRIERALGNHAQADTYSRILQSRFPNSEQARRASEREYKRRPLR